jgi:gamma-glutamyltranspeptidase/glutathione hydrolase
VAGLLVLASVVLGNGCASPEKIGWRGRGRGGAVAAGKAEAVAAGLSVLETGGNAADAAVATILALAITDYRSFCIGAEAPFMIYSAQDHKVHVLSGVGGAPLDPEVARWYYENGIPSDGGIRAAPVPAAVSTCFKALELFGTRSFEEVVAPAISLLDAGGEEWYPRLAVTLRKLVEEERRTSGSREDKLRAARDRFYKGDIAYALTEWYAEQGGFLRLEDLAEHETFLEEPVQVSYRGYTVCKCGPWTQGPYLLQTLRLLERFDLRSLGQLSADTVHLAVEALKLGLADRDAYYGDPRFVDVPLEGLLSDEYTSLRAPLIDLERASTEIRPGDPVGMQPLLAAGGEYRPGEGGTTTCCVADRWGNLVAATPSGNPPYVDPPGGTTGVAHGNRLRSLNTTEGHPNRLEPGKRPRITLTPTLVLREGKPVLAVSVAGGDLQDQVTLNLLLDFIDFGLSPAEAVRVPRFSTGHHENSFDPNPDRRATVPGLTTIRFSGAIPEEVPDDLRARGHEVTESDRPIGYPVMLAVDPDDGAMAAAGDPAAGRHAAALP